MRPWTTRTLQAAAVAAGFAAAGAGTAAAAQVPEPIEPDLSAVPDEIGFTAPINACSTQDGPGYNSVKAPCVDAQLRVSAPNVVKQVGADVAELGTGVARELGDGRTVSTDKLARISQHVGEAKNDVLGLAKTRPTIGVSANPRHTGVLEPHAPNSTLLDAQIGPRGENHEGVSGLDTAVDLTAAQSYTVGPVANPGRVLNEPVLRLSPHDAPHVDLPKVSELAPGAGAKVAELTGADRLTEVPDQVVHGVGAELGAGVQRGLGQGVQQVRHGLGDGLDGTAQGLRGGLHDAHQGLQSGLRGELPKPG